MLNFSSQHRMDSGAYFIVLCFRNFNQVSEPRLGILRVVQYHIQYAHAAYVGVKKEKFYINYPLQINEDDPLFLNLTRNPAVNAG